ncbi:hypothetical protein [Azospirillum palustre]
MANGNAFNLPSTAILKGIQHIATPTPGGAFKASSFRLYLPTAVASDRLAG